MPLSEAVISTVSGLYLKIADEIREKNRQVRVSAITFFHKVYQNGDHDDLTLFYGALAAFHLAAKINDINLKLNILVNAACKIVQDAAPGLPVIHRVPVDDKEFRSGLAQNIISEEHNLIYALNFDFRSPRPFETLAYYVRRIVSWHRGLRPIRDKMIVDAETFASDMLRTNAFTSYPADIISMVAVSLAFDKAGLSLQGSCIQALLPYRNLEEFAMAREKMCLYFKDVLTSGPTPIGKVTRRDIETWDVYPLEEVKPAEEMCPPPKFELMREVSGSGEDDTFCHAWWEHAPKVPPPSPKVMNGFWKKKDYVNARPLSSEKDVSDFGEFLRPAVKREYDDSERQGNRGRGRGAYSPKRGYRDDRDRFRDGEYQHDGSRRDEYWRSEDRRRDDDEPNRGNDEHRRDRQDEWNRGERRNDSPRDWRRDDRYADKHQISPRRDYARDRPRDEYRREDSPSDRRRPDYRREDSPSNRRKPEYRRGDSPGDRRREDYRRGSPEARREYRRGDSPGSARRVYHNDEQPYPRRDDNRKDDFRRSGSPDDRRRGDAKEERPRAQSPGDRRREPLYRDDKPRDSSWRPSPRNSDRGDFRRRNEERYDGGNNDSRRGFRRDDTRPGTFHRKDEHATDSQGIKNQ